MSTPFLQNFAALVIDRLVAGGHLTLTAEGRGQIGAALFVADALARAKNASLISTTARALLDCPDVDELFADDATLQAVVDDLDPASVRV